MSIQFSNIRLHKNPDGRFCFWDLNTISRVPVWKVERLAKNAGGCISNVPVQKLPTENIYPLGNHNSMEVFPVANKGCRTESQMKAFIKFFNENSYDFLNINPFELEPDGKTFNCSFYAWFIKDGKVNSIKITPTGQIKQN